MDVEIGVPQTPVALVPGEATRVPIEVGNVSTAPMSVRVSVVRNRAGAWSDPDQPVLELPPGDRVAVEVVFRPPASAVPSSTLLPFTVQAEDLRYGVTAGRATGLVALTAGQRLDATLVRGVARRGATPFTLSLRNRGSAPLTVRVEPATDRPGRVDADPPVVDLPGGVSATAQVVARPRVPLVGAATPYAVTVSCRDASAGDEAPPLATVIETGTAAPRIGRTMTTVLAGTALIAATGGAVLLGGVRLPWRGPASPPPAATVEVRRPYALVDVFPRQDGPGGRPAAEAALARLTAAGMPVRLVDSTTSDAVADGRDGFWVLLHDGLPTVEEARAYCDRYRPIAPKCEVVP